MKQVIDFSLVHERHGKIHYRLEEWNRWVRVSPQAFCVQPMFQGYRSMARQWEENPHIHEEINSIDAHEIEKAVSALPDKHRTVVRWCYVFPWVPVTVVRRNVGETQAGLREILTKSLDMLTNTVRP